MSTSTKSVTAAHQPPAPALASAEESTSAAGLSTIVESADPAEAPASAKARLAFPLALTILAVLPIAFGVGAVRLKASISAAQQAAADVQAESETEEALPESIPTDRRLGDRQFLERRYEVALQYYRSLGSPDPARLPADLLYRIALSQEGLGLWNEALVSLRSVSDATESPLLRAAASFGQARIWFRLNEPGQAVPLLRSLQLHSDIQHPLPRNMSREIAFLLPLALAQEFVSNGTQTGQGVAISFGDLLTWPLETALAWAEEPAATEDTEPDDAIPPTTEAVASTICRVKRPATEQAPPTSIEEVLIDLRCDGQSLGSVLNSLATECHWDYDSNAGSTNPCLQRLVKISVEECPVTVLLTAVCSECQSVWSIDDNRLTITPANPENSRSWRMIARTLDSVTIWLPHHRLAEHARFAQGQLAQHDGDLAKAAFYFSSLAGRDSSPLAIRAAYNAATILYRLGDLPHACTQLAYVVDGAPDSRLHTDALIFLGRLLLDRGDIQEAIYRFRRAAESRGQPNEQARASVFLGMAFLMQDKFLEAAEAMFAHKAQLDQVDEPRIRIAASFVNAFARWQSVTGDVKEREATFLYRALLAIRSDSEWLGQTGRVLMGRAYVELGFEDHMADLYSHLLSTGMTESIESEMVYSLGDYEYTSGRIDAAKVWWDKLSARTFNRWTNLARKRLAEVALTEGRAKETLELCEQIHVGEGVTKSDIQKLMGRAFELLGEDVLAARCYAGQLPIH